MQPVRLALAASLVAVALLRSADAAACGGCFHDPSENPSVVTDHRMIFSISKDQTTLYDQMRYSGDPASFAWVLPVHGTVEVGLSADVVFASLDSLTQTQIRQPQVSCPVLDCCWGQGGGFFDASAAADGSTPGVVVTKSEVVGPYETVQLSATDPQALANWLAANKFVIPPDIQPIIAQYVSEKFDFLAMKLAPGKSVRSMRPVRVTTPGAGLALPLRMVGAGTGAVVGVTLWVVGEGRYEPKNFQSFRIGDEELIWDFASSRSNYAELRAQKTAAANGAAFELESALPFNQAVLTNLVKNGGRSFGPPAPAADDYSPVTGPNPKTEAEVRDADLATLFHGIPQNGTWITRMRGDIAHSALTSDLALGASSDQSTLGNVHVPKNVKNAPACPTQCPAWAQCEAGTDAGDAPVSVGGGAGCAVSGEEDRGRLPFASFGIFALVTGSIVRRITRRARKPS